MNTEMIILAVAMVAAFFAGSWITYKAYQHKNPIMFIDKDEELPDIVSPYEQSQKNVRVKL